jgi:hypothetical protein
MSSNSGGEANLACDNANSPRILGVTGLAAIALDVVAEPNFFVAPSD